MLAIQKPVPGPPLWGTGDQKEGRVTDLQRHDAHEDGEDHAQLHTAEYEFPDEIMKTAVAMLVGLI